MNINFLNTYLHKASKSGIRYDNAFTPKYLKVIKISLSQATLGI